MLDTDEYLIPGLISRSVIDIIVHPILLAATTATSRSAMMVTRLRHWGVRNGRAVEKEPIAIAGRSMCTGSNHTRSSLRHLSRRSAVTLGDTAGGVLYRPAWDSLGTHAGQRRFCPQPS